VIDVLFHAVARSFDNDVSHMSAGVAYYAILSLFPLLIAAVSIASAFLEPDYVTEQLVVFLGRYMPVSVELIERNVQDVLRLRGALGAVSLLMLLWSGSAMFGALSRVVNRVWEVERRRPFLKEKMLHLAMVFVAGGLFAASILTTVFLQLASSFELEPLGGSQIWRQGAVQFGAYAAAFTFTAVTFLLTYRILPNTQVAWRDIWPGAVAAAVLFETLKSGFVIYLGYFSNPELVYGSLSSVVVILLWCYLSAHIFIIGAALGAERRLEARRRGDAPGRPMVGGGD